MKRLLWVGDAACPSGFARATHGILDTVCLDFEVTVLGLNYNGDKHGYPYDIYSCWPGGDLFGIGRLIWMCDIAKPDVIVIQNDGWNIPHYVQKLKQFPEYRNVPIVAAVALDGKNFQGHWLNHVTHTVFWTQFGLDEARDGLFTGPASVIPLGVDTGTYRPMDRREARSLMGVDALQDKFVVGQVNRNQLRKRWDLTIKCFSDWVHRREAVRATSRR